MTSPTNRSDVPLGCGFIIALFMFALLITTVVVAVAWNVGLYGAGIVDNKIGFWTALGLAFAVSVLRSIFARSTSTKDKA